MARKDPNRKRTHPLKPPPRSRKQKINEQKSLIELLFSISDLSCLMLYELSAGVDLSKSRYLEELYVQALSLMAKEIVQEGSTPLAITCPLLINTRFFIKALLKQTSVEHAYSHRETADALALADANNVASRDLPEFLAVNGGIAACARCYREIEEE